MILRPSPFFPISKVITITVQLRIIVGLLSPYIEQIKRFQSWAWWRSPLIPTLRRQRQADFWVWGKPGLQSEFQDNQDYTEKPCLENQTNKNKQTKETILKLKLHIKHCILIMGDFNIPHSPRDRSLKKKLNRKIMKLAEVMNQVLNL